MSAAARVAASTITQAALARVADPPGSNRVRVEDYLAALAACTGEAAIVAVGIDIEELNIAPGSALFGDRINEVLTGDIADLSKVPADSVVGILIAELVPAVVSLADFGSVEELYRSVAASVGKTEWGEVHLTVPDDNLPRISPLRLAFEMRPAVEAACYATGVVAPAGYQACALALAQGLERVRDSIDIKVGLRLALEVVFGMAKMAPMSKRAFAEAAGDNP